MGKQVTEAAKAGFKNRSRTRKLQNHTNAEFAFQTIMAQLGIKTVTSTRISIIEGANKDAKITETTNAALSALLKFDRRYQAMMEPVRRILKQRRHVEEINRKRQASRVVSQKYKDKLAAIKA